MRERGVDPNHYILTNMLKIVPQAEPKLQNHLLSFVVDELLAHNITFNSHVWYGLVDSYTTSPHLGKLHRRLRSAIRGVASSPSMVCVFVPADGVLVGRELVRTIMPLCGVEPTPYTYWSVIRGFCALSDPGALLLVVFGAEGTIVL